MVCVCVLVCFLNSIYHMAGINQGKCVQRHARVHHFCVHVIHAEPQYDQPKHSLYDPAAVPNNRSLHSIPTIICSRVLQSRSNTSSLLVFVKFCQLRPFLNGTELSLIKQIYGNTNTLQQFKKGLLVGLPQCNTFFLCMCVREGVCVFVSVCQRERERERDPLAGKGFNHISFWVCFLVCLFVVTYIVPVAEINYKVYIAVTGQGKAGRQGLTWSPLQLLHHPPAMHSTRPPVIPPPTP